MSFIDVAAGLVFRQRKLLITQRHAESHLGGLWEFPGGKREPGETFEQCLVRELREELGIEVTLGPLIESVLHTYPEKTVQLKFYRCEWLRGEPQMLGCAALEWIHANQLSAYAFPAADARLLARLQTDASLWEPLSDTT
jgi:8-oxo-dGTP diphosphatase